MTYNSADIKAFQNVWVFCEQRGGVMAPTSAELLSEGRKLADNLGAELCGVLLGNGVDGIAKELGTYGADKVYVYNSPLLETYTTDAYTKVLEQAVREFKPEILLFSASRTGRDLAPRCAARLQTGLCADCTHLAVDMDEYMDYLRKESSLDPDQLDWDQEDYDIRTTLKMSKPAFGEHLMATIVAPTQAVIIAPTQAVMIASTQAAIGVPTQAVMIAPTQAVLIRFASAGTENAKVV